MPRCVLAVLDRFWTDARWPRPFELCLLGILLIFTYRFFWLMDDAFIYFRYLDNLLFLGRGLVFNRGEYVEGYSSPAWLLLLLPLRATGIDYFSLVRALSLVCAAAFGAALIAINRRLSPPGSTLVNFPLAASAAHYGLTTHFSSGLEAPLVQLAACAYAAACLWPRARWLQVMIGASPLVRPELALCALIWAVCYVAARRELPRSFIASLVLVNGAWLAFRIYYYADLLPNTFYLKDVSDWQQGYYYLRNTWDAHWGNWVLAALLGLAWFGRRLLFAPADGFRRPRLAMLSMALVECAYVTRVGGDMLYYRYLAFAVCLALCASGGVLEAALATLPAERFRPALAIFATTLVALSFFAGYPPQLASHPLWLTQRMRLVHEIADPMWHRRHTQLRLTPKRSAEDVEQRRRYATATQQEREQQAVLVHPWCRRAYLEFDKYVVHNLGLTEPFLARLPASFGRPGHKHVRREARQLAELRERDGLGREPGSIGRSIEARGKRAPRWMRRNRESLALLERKIYNRHVFAENLELAFSRVVLR